MPREGAWILPSAYREVFWEDQAGSRVENRLEETEQDWSKEESSESYCDNPGRDGGGPNKVLLHF